MSRDTLNKLQDKYSYLPLFARMMKEPYEVFSSSSGYKISIDDFEEKFHKYLFSAIANLHEEGVTKITKIEINAYLQKHYKEQHRVFKDNGGDEYVDRALKLEEVQNFDYHYNRVKKFSLLRHYVREGINISDIYDVNEVEIKESEEQSERFNKMTVVDIIKHVDAKVVKVKSDFLIDKDGVGGKFSDNIDEIFENLSKGLNFGANFVSGFLNTISRGQRLRKLYCISGNSGSGKTRSMLAHLLNVCAPEMYVDGQWIKTNNKGRGLFISTELEEVEIKVPAVCFIADVEEDKVHNQELTEEEKERLAYAREVLKATPIWFEELFDFDNDDIEGIIEKYVYQENVMYVSFDYMHSTLKMFESLGKSGARNLQEHQVLRIMSIRLKNMANRYNIFIMTSTQLNESWKQGALDHSALEGSKSIVNKLDLGAIQIALTQQDEALFDELMKNSQIGMMDMPTHTINIYKNRGNKWKLVRVWVKFNLGTLRMKDLFVTNYKGEIIEKIKPTMVDYFLDDSEDEEFDEVFALDSRQEENKEILDVLNNPEKYEDDNDLMDLF